MYYKCLECTHNNDDILNQLSAYIGNLKKSN